MKGRVLLIVPPYTRIKRPLDVVERNIERGVKDGKRLEKYRRIIAELRSLGINELSEMKRAGMPVGLLRIAAAAKKRGYETGILDCPYEGWENETESHERESGNILVTWGLSEKEIEGRIREYGPDVVGITCPYTHQNGNAKRLSGLVKRVTEGKVPVVLGGAGPHGEPEEFLKYSHADYVVTGQGDETFPKLLDVILGGTDEGLEDMPGLVYRKGWRTLRNGPGAPVRDLDRTSVDLDMIDIGMYNRWRNSMGEEPVKRGYQAILFTSSGCNTRCSFCQIPNIHGPYAAMSDGKLREVIGYMKSRGVRHVLIEDDNIAFDMDRLARVYGMLKDASITSSCEGGIALYSFNFLMKRDEAKAESIIRQMAGGGCRHIYLAVESGLVSSLRASGKPTVNADLELSRKTVSLFRKYGIKVTAGLIIGMPKYEENEDGMEKSETIEEIEYTISYMNALGADCLNPFISTPLPGTVYGKRFSDVRKTHGSGCSHEFATYDAPAGEWIGDELNLLRVYAMGIGNYKKTLETGTWA